MPGNWSKCFIGYFRSSKSWKMWLFLVLLVVPVGVLGTTATATPVSSTMEPITTDEERSKEAVYSKESDDGKSFDLQSFINDTSLFSATCNDITNDAVYRNSMEPNALANARSGLSAGSEYSVPGPSGNASMVSKHTLEKHFHSDCPADPLSCQVDEGFTIAMWFSVHADDSKWYQKWWEDEECTLVSINNDVVITSSTSAAANVTEVNVLFRSSTSNKKMTKFKISSNLTEVMEALLTSCVNTSETAEECTDIKFGWQWNHLVVTAKRSNSDNFKVGLYYNGNAIREGQIMDAEIIDELAGTDQSGIVLNNGMESAGCDTVAFDDFAMWNRSLTQEEIVELRVSTFCNQETTKPQKIDLKEVLRPGTIPKAEEMTPENAKNATFVKSTVSGMTEAFENVLQVHEYVDKTQLSTVIGEALNTTGVFASSEALFQGDKATPEEKKAVVESVAQFLDVSAQIITESNIPEQDRNDHMQKVINTAVSITNNFMASGEETSVQTDSFDIQVKQIVANAKKLQLGDVTIPKSSLGDSPVAAVITMKYSQLKNTLPIEVEGTVARTTVLGGDMISINLADYESGTTLPEPITFEITVQADDKDRVPDCAYQIPDGKFATMGVKTIKKDGKTITCETDHATNFAVLMSVSSIKVSDTHLQNLSTVSIVCISLSLVALFISILILFIFRDLHGTRISILKHLSIAMFIAQLVFVTAIERAAVNRKLCLVIAVFLHYLNLAVFFWMLAQGIFLYMKLRLAVRSDANIIWFCLIGWGFPAIMVTTTAGINIGAYGGPDGLCWLNTNDGGAWAFVGPVLGIIAINCVVIVMAMKAFVSVKSFKDKDDKEKFKSTLKAMVVMLPLLGLTWFFGVFAHIPGAGGLAFMYIFNICNGLQGFFLFIFHIVFNAEIQKVMRRAFMKRSGSVGAGEEPSFFRKMLGPSSEGTQTSDFGKSSSM